jgi:hypothetical protein
MKKDFFLEGFVLTLAAWLFAWLCLGALIGALWWGFTTAGMPEVLRCLAIAVILYPPRWLQEAQNKLWGDEA